MPRVLFRAKVKQKEKKLNYDNLVVSRMLLSFMYLTMNMNKNIYLRKHLGKLKYAMLSFIAKKKKI